MIIQKLLSSLSNNNKRILGLTCINFSVFGFLFFAFSFIDLKQEKTSVYVNAQFEKLLQTIDSLELSVASGKPCNQQQYYYSLARKNYKHLEAVIEYVAPFFAKYYINGPPIKKHDIESGNKVFEPHGFQLIEPAFFSNDSSLSKNNLIYEIKLLKESLFQTQKKFKSVIPRRQQYFGMIQMELVRIISLNINGYDCSVTKQNITETSYALEGITDLLSTLENEKVKSNSLSSIKILIKTTNAYLLKNNDYNTFNRLHFIVTYIKPLYALISTYKIDLRLGNTPVNYAINFSENKLFGEKFFNRRFFSVTISDSFYIKQQAELGRNLFFDPILSGNNQRACASCHKPQFAFADTVSKSFEYNRTDFIKRNAPSLINVMYQKSFFYDGRSLQLEDQISDVLHAKNEMNTLPAEVVNRLRQSNEYKLLFKKAFKGQDTAITFYAILKSIAEFEKTLVSMNSRFDKYLKGNKNALTKDEINGYTIFSGKALCGSCHFLPLFNGLVPPVFNDNEFEVIGTLTGPDAKEIDRDSGRVAITKKSMHVFSFKTPGIRNCEYTFPYMHNGSYKNLEQVIEFYNKGGGSMAKEKIYNQTLPFDSLQLSSKEKADIKSFLISLSDNPFKEIAPKKLPQIQNSTLDKRKIGGTY